MFETIEDRSGFPFGGFVLHLFLALIIPAGGALLTLFVLGVIFVALQLPKIAGTAIVPIGYLGVGVTSGFYIQRWSRLATNPGKFAFVLPLCLWSIGFVVQSVGSSVAEAFDVLFWPSSEGDTAIAVIFLRSPLSVLAATQQEFGWLAGERNGSKRDREVQIGPAHPESFQYRATTFVQLFDEHSDH